MRTNWTAVISSILFLLSCAGSMAAETGSDGAALTFGLDRVPALSREIPPGVPAWQYLASILYLFLAFAAAKAMDLVARAYFKRMAERTQARVGNAVLAVVVGPIRVITFIVLLHIGLRVFRWPEVVEHFLSQGLKIVVALSLTYMAVRLVDVLLGYWKARAAEETDATFDRQLYPMIRRSLQVFVVVVAILLTSHNLGLNITSLIASLSIGGLALGLAAQDTLGNLFGAVSVFLDKPFRVGERVQLNGLDGVVEEIGVRSTRIRSLDGHLITVPNKTVGNATITNVSQRPNIRTIMNIGITYDTPTDKVKQALAILEEVYKRHPMTFDCWISFNQFAESSLNILVIHWWNSTVYKDYLQGMQEMNLTLKTRFDEAGISFAFPSRTIYLKQDSDWNFTGNGNEPQAAEGVRPGSR